MTTHVMVDLETASTASDAAILSIGAVAFDPDNLEFRRSFYLNVSLRSCLAENLRFDASTFYWWARQDSSAGEAIQGDQLPLRNVLADFGEFLSGLGSPQQTRMWSNGATFDIPILENAYHALGGSEPWSFWAVRCYRTISNLVPKDFHPWDDTDGTKHNALRDAEYQTNRLLAIAKELNLDLK